MIPLLLHWRRKWRRRRRGRWRREAKGEHTHPTHFIRTFDNTNTHTHYNWLTNTHTLTKGQPPLEQIVCSERTGAETAGRGAPWEMESHSSSLEEGRADGMADRAGEDGTGVCVRVCVVCLLASASQTKGTARPVLCTYPADLHQVGHHDNGCRVLLPDHPPEVIHRLLHWAWGWRDRRCDGVTEVWQYWCHLVF